MDFSDIVIARVIGCEVDLYQAYARVVSESDIEALHDFRIHLRRLRSLLNPLGMKGVSAELEKAAAEVGRLTTPIRDMEVIAGELERHNLSESALSRRNMVLRWYREADGNPVISKLFFELSDWPPAFRSALAEMHIDQLKKRTTKRIARQLVRLSFALSDPGHDRHEIRLLAKRARYSQEAYPNLYPLPAHLLVGLKQLQSSLGDWHDRHQWCLKAESEADLEALIDTWRQAERAALHAAEQLITTLATELAEFLGKKNAA